ncbi:hypothetical protein ACFU96_34635 [Streptomyces sp. NPDC057620]|uniref:hypothetical protein n=1 Tax=Streptomyces sp. NPDC057620 TaxID=3346185 RepID=UPI003674A19B
MAEVRALHAAQRDAFRGPDEIVEVERMRLVDLPREQKIATVVAPVLQVGSPASVKSTAPVPPPPRTSRLASAVTAASAAASAEMSRK